MTEYQLKRRAVINFSNYKVPKHVQRKYQRQWLQCIATLGSRWLFAQSIKRANHD